MTPSPHVLVTAAAVLQAVDFWLSAQGERDTRRAGLYVFLAAAAVGLAVYTYANRSTK